MNTHAHTHTRTSLQPHFFYLPLSGQCNGWWICCLLMHTADKLSLSDHGPAAVWFVKDGTRQDESAAQIEKGHWGYRQTKKVHLKKIIYLRAYGPPGCGWAASACECMYVWVRLKICETRFSNDLAVWWTTRIFIVWVCMVVYAYTQKASPTKAESLRFHNCV